MHKRWTTLGIGLLVALALAATAVAMDVAELLQALDDARFLAGTVGGFTVSVVSESNGEVEEAELELAFKEIDGEDYTRIDFLAPEEIAGQVFLVTPEATYFWQPELFEPIRTSGAQAAFGDAPVAQISGIRFLGDYTIAARREVAGEAGTPLLEVELEATRPGVAFQRIVVRADAASLTPRELELYAATGVLLYRVILTGYDELDGDKFVRDQIVEDALRAGNRTTLSILSVRTEPLPDELFDQQALGD